MTATPTAFVFTNPRARFKIARRSGTWTIWCGKCHRGATRTGPLAVLHHEAMCHVNGHRIFDQIDGFEQVGG